MRLEASRSSQPKDWVKAPTVSFQPRLMMASAMSSLVIFHPSLDPVAGAQAVGQGDGPVEGDPAHELAVEEVAG
ncbi:MAG TPA: hypothetical protein VKD67_10320, partial [Acidimicrobiales bacterium]|nr:hypothetical protein [Acidimicrobiales bacterium]